MHIAWKAVEGSWSTFTSGRHERSCKLLQKWYVRSIHQFSNGNFYVMLPSICVLLQQAPTGFLFWKCDLPTARIEPASGSRRYPFPSPCRFLPVSTSAGYPPIERRIPWGPRVGDNVDSTPKDNQKNTTTRPFQNHHSVLHLSLQVGQQLLWQGPVCPTVDHPQRQHMILSRIVKWLLASIQIGIATVSLERNARLWWLARPRCTVSNSQWKTFGLGLITK